MAEEESSASESSHVKRAREKLKKQLAHERRMFNPERLQEVSKVMRNWIDRHQSERVSLKNKAVRFFDGNENPAKISSNFVKQLQAQLETGEEKVEEPAVEHQSLKGRVITQDEMPKSESEEDAHS